MSLTFRDLLKKITPRWLQRDGGIAHRLLYSFGVMLDLVGDGAVFGVRRRFPGYDADGADAFELVGRDRKIRRGRNEIDANYAARLQRWLEDHRTRGGPYAMLAQLHAHYADAPFRARLITRAGVQYDMAADGTITRSTLAAWNPDAHPERWARWWLIYDWPTTLDTSPTWGGGIAWGALTPTWGTPFSRAEIEDLRLVPTEWNAAHTTGTLVVSHGGILWGVGGHTWGEIGRKWGGGKSVTLAIQ